MLMMLSIASVCCLAATSAEDKAESKKEKVETKAAAGETKEEAKKDTEKKFTAKCPVSGAAAKQEQFASYKEKQVYFCCEKCKAAFEAEPTKFEVKANHQLVQTKQFKQKKCPISGGNIVKEQSARVANVNVRFCCEKCKGKVQEAEATAKLEMIFAEAAFKKAFVAVKEKTEDGDAKAKPKAGKPRAAKPDAEKKAEAK
jgi:YHS domain-containing protein